MGPRRPRRVADCRPCSARAPMSSSGVRSARAAPCGWGRRYAELFTVGCVRIVPMDALLAGFGRGAPSDADQDPSYGCLTRHCRRWRNPFVLEATAMLQNEADEKSGVLLHGGSPARCERGFRSYGTPAARRECSRRLVGFRRWGMELPIYVRCRHAILAILQRNNTILPLRRSVLTLHGCRRHIVADRRQPRRGACQGRGRRY